MPITKFTTLANDSAIATKIELSAYSVRLNALLTDFYQKKKALKTVDDYVQLSMIASDFLKAANQLVAQVHTANYPWVSSLVSQQQTLASYPELSKLLQQARALQETTNDLIIRRLNEGYLENLIDSIDKPFIEEPKPSIKGPKTLTVSQAMTLFSLLAKHDKAQSAPLIDTLPPVLQETLILAPKSHLPYLQLARWDKELVLYPLKWHEEESTSSKFISDTIRRPDFLFRAANFRHRFIKSHSATLLQLHDALANQLEADSAKPAAIQALDKQLAEFTQRLKSQQVGGIRRLLYRQRNAFLSDYLQVITHQRQQLVQHCRHHYQTQLDALITDVTNTYPFTLSQCFAKLPDLRSRCQEVTYLKGYLLVQQEAGVSPVSTPSSDFLLAENEAHWKSLQQSQTTLLSPSVLQNKADFLKQVANDINNLSPQHRNYRRLIAALNKLQKVFNDEEPVSQLPQLVKELLGNHPAHDHYTQTFLSLWLKDKTLSSLDDSFETVYAVLPKKAQAIVDDEQEYLTHLLTQQPHHPSDIMAALKFLEQKIPAQGLQSDAQINRYLNLVKGIANVFEHHIKHTPHYRHQVAYHLSQAAFKKAIQKLPDAIDTQRLLQLQQQVDLYPI